MAWLESLLVAQWTVERTTDNWEVTGSTLVEDLDRSFLSPTHAITTVLV